MIFLSISPPEFVGLIGVAISVGAGLLVLGAAVADGAAFTYKWKKETDREANRPWFAPAKE